MKKPVRCDECGARAELEIVPDSFDEKPESFTLTRTCEGACKTTYLKLTLEEAEQLAGRDYDRGSWS